MCETERTTDGVVVYRYVAHVACSSFLGVNIYIYVYLFIRTHTLQCELGLITLCHACTYTNQPYTHSPNKQRIAYQSTSIRHRTHILTHVVHAFNTHTNGFNVYSVSSDDMTSAEPRAEPHTSSSAFVGAHRVVCFQSSFQSFRNMPINYS